MADDGYSGGIVVTIANAMVIAGFFAISLYNVLEINIQVFFTFLKWKGLYFWSLLISSWGIVLHSVGFLLQFFQFCTNDYVNITIITLGGIPMVIGQSVVLYSRLHLIVYDRRKIRWVLIMIISSFFLFTIPPTVLNYGSNSSNPAPFIGPFKVYEKVMLFGFAAQEITISGIYLWETRKMLRVMEPGMSEAPRRVMRHLIYVNILVILMDLSIIGTELGGLHDIQTTYKSVVYSVKLKLEFPVLNQLRNLVKREGHGYSLSSSHLSSVRSPGQGYDLSTRRHSSVMQPVFFQQQTSPSNAPRQSPIKPKALPDVESCTPPEDYFSSGEPPE
ncbi:hypothetical protein V2G26_004907 [Clonostachys chloroleuca]